ncbi:MAG TPA: peptidoglycan DD-metalloendopeptidase family protein [Kofleriaceae bacterium]
MTALGAAGLSMPHSVASAKELTPEETKAKQAKQAGQQLEAFFMRTLLAEARPQGGAGPDSGFAGDTFKQMLDEALSDKMSAAGGIGLAGMFAKQLDGTAQTANAQIGAIAQSPTSEVPGTIRSIGANGSGMNDSGIGSIPDPRIVGPEIGNAPRFALPVAGRASSGYGERVDPINHTSQIHPGFDLAAPTGTRVGAAAGGTVVHAGPAGTYGNLVTIRHEDGFETRYAHLSKVDVKAGDHVSPGQEVGEVGTTGHSTGPHLHFEIRKEGKALDPKPYLPLNPSQIRATR